MRYLLLFVVGIFLSSFACGLHAQSQTEMNMTAQADLNKADAKLNQLYRRVLSQNTENEQLCANLKDAQRTWLKFVDFHMKTVFPLKDGEDPRVVYGSIYPLDFAVTKTALIDQRIEQLESISQDSTE